MGAVLDSLQLQRLEVLAVTPRCDDALVPPLIRPSYPRDEGSDELLLHIVQRVRRDFLRDLLASIVWHQQGVGTFKMRDGMGLQPRRARSWAARWLETSIYI